MDVTSSKLARRFLISLTRWFQTASALAHLAYIPARQAKSARMASGRTPPAYQAKSAPLRSRSH
jgi:hypothetical protein